MKELDKLQIKAHLASYCERMGSQNKAANSLKGVSSAVLSQVLNDNWDLISGEMWRSIAAQTGYVSQRWVTVETRGYQRMYSILSDAQKSSEVLAVTGDAGSGKSEAIMSYTRANKGVYTLVCSEYWNRKFFLSVLLKTMGRDPSGFTVGEMMEDVIFFLKKESRPLLVLDEFDKLTDQVLYFFISIYNALEGRVGIVISSTNYLERRIKKGLQSNRKGYAEIYSRFGRKFIPMPLVSHGDVTAVCAANGITDRKVIEKIIDDCAFDMRRVKRLVHAESKKKETKGL